jgi:heat shock protein HslJ
MQQESLDEERTIPVKKIIFSLGLSVVLLALASCASSRSGGGGDLSGKVWALSELTGKSLVAGSGITALFSSGGQVGGSAGCNQYLGIYTVSGNTITVSSPMASTMMMCDPAVMLQENAYLSALGEAKTYTVKGDQLTLVSADKSRLAVYQAQSQDLSGTSWEVIGYNNGKQAVTSVLAGSTLTADFGKDGTLSGNSGCNTYNGPYTVSGNQIKIGPLATTRMACSEPAGVMEQEAQYLAALETAATYQIEGVALELRTKDGALAADFSKK